MEDLSKVKVALKIFVNHIIRTFK